MFFDLDSVSMLRAARRMVDDGVLLNGKDMDVPPNYF